MCHLVQSGQVTGNISLSRNPDKKKLCSFFKRVLMLLFYNYVNVILTMCNLQTNLKASHAQSIKCESSKQLLVV